MKSTEKTHKNSQNTILLDIGFIKKINQENPQKQQNGDGIRHSHSKTIDGRRGSSDKGLIRGNDWWEVLDKGSKALIRGTSAGIKNGRF